MNNILKKKFKILIGFKYIYFVCFSDDSNNNLKINNFLIQNETEKTLNNEEKIFSFENLQKKEEKKGFLKKLFSLQGVLISNILIYNNHIYMIMKKNSEYFFLKRNLINEKIFYYPLKNIKFKKSLKFKVNNEGEDFTIIDTEGNLYLYINNYLIFINEKILIPIYDKPLIKKKNSDLLIYLFHGPDIVSEITINDYLNIKITQDIIYKVLHQEEEYNNQYFNFNRENHLLIDEYLIISTKNSYLYIYKDNKLVWSKCFNNSYNNFIKNVSFNNENYIYTFNFYNGQIYLFDLKTGDDIWNYNHNESIINGYFIKETENFIFLDYKFNLFILNKKGEKKFTINILNILKKEKVFNRIYNFFIIKDKIIFFTDVGIYTLYSNLEKNFYTPMIVKEENLILYDDKYVFFAYNNKIYVI
jgi:hypothetical protein